jgi:hypothetical protein
MLLFYSVGRATAPFVWRTSPKLGRAGDRHLADFLDLDPYTVARGRQQLLAQDVGPDRAQNGRRASAGEKKAPK